LLEANQGAELRFEQLPFNHPLYILYSSGTTGKPKCIVHGAGGTLLQHIKEQQLHTDLCRDDVFFYFTTCGWMMWNWLVSGLASGCTVVCYDGSPFAHDGDRLLDAIDAEGITVFGVGAKYIDALEKAGKQPRLTHSLASLRTMLSTGSPLSAHSFEWVYQQVKADVCLSSISGGTDIISCFVLGNPNLPVYAGEIQCSGLGMAVAIFNERGEPVVGEKGELVCTRPFPCAPVGFWNDEDGARYHRAYFARFDNVWAHGDYGELTDRGTAIIYGRSDAVLNPGGVRIGTAEIYRQVETLAEIVDSVVVGQQWQDDERVVLFVVVRDQGELTPELEQRLRTTIREHATPRHVPARIIAVPDVPKTISGKVSELAVKHVIHGRAVDNADALANPESLTYFEQARQLLD
jgi:acetoacetyl-CoA synthetase